MSRLIDADAPIKVLNKNSIFQKVTNVEGKNTIEIINEQPTIEAVPVVHGEWEICEEPNVFDTCGNPATYARCKNCGFRWSNKYHVKNYFNHCPNCGADMRKGGAE